MLHLTNIYTHTHAHTSLQQMFTIVCKTLSATVHHIPPPPPPPPPPLIYVCLPPSRISLMQRRMRCLWPRAETPRSSRSWSWSRASRQEPSTEWSRKVSTNCSRPRFDIHFETWSEDQSLGSLDMPPAQIDSRQATLTRPQTRQNGRTQATLTRPHTRQNGRRQDKMAAHKMVTTTKVCTTQYSAMSALLLQQVEQ